MLCRTMIYSEVSIMLLMDYTHFYFPAFYSAATAVEDNVKNRQHYSFIQGTPVFLLRNTEDVIKSKHSNGEENYVQSQKLILVCVCIDATLHR